MSGTAARCFRVAEAGFTLLELLVSLAVIGLAAILLATGLPQALRAASTVEHAAQDADATVSLHAFLRRLLSNAYPATVRGSPDFAYRLTFVGESDAMELTSLLPPPAGAPGLVRVALYRRSTPQGAILEMAWAVERNRPERVRGAGEAPTVAVAGPFADLRFSYAEASADGSALAWRDSWPDPRSMPRFVRIDASIRRNGEAMPLPLPTMVATLPADVDSSCVLDLLSRRCRGR